MPDVKFCLVFQRETLSVPVMRRVLGDTLRGLGVDEESVYDILLAATEACTNVLTHGGRKVRGYAVVTSLGAVGCQVEVADARDRPAPRPRNSCRARHARRLSPIRSRYQSPSCPNRAAAWPSCAGLRGQRHAGQPPRPRHGRDHAQAHQVAGRRPAAPAPRGQLTPARPSRISFLGADRGYHLPRVARRPGRGARGPARRGASRSRSGTATAACAAWTR